MPVELVCKCGKQLRIPEEHAGRRIMCPNCGASHVAPGAEEQRPLSPPSAGKRRTLLLMVVLLLLLGGAGAVWWFLFREAGPTKEGDDLALIPANAQGFISVRLADLWKTPAAQKGLKDARQGGNWTGDPAEQIERKFGLRPEEVERLTLVSVDADRKIGWGIVRTLQPYDRRKVLSRLNDRREIVYGEERYHLGAGPDGNPRAIHFAGTRVLVAGTEESVKRCLDFAAGIPPAGPLAPVIALAAGDHTAVAGIQPSGLGGPLEKLKAIPFLQNMVGNLVKGLTDVKLVTATLDVGENATLEAKLKMASDAEAKRMVQMIEENKEKLQGMLFAAALVGAVNGQVGELARMVLGKARFVQQDDEATMTATIDKGSKVAELLMTLPRR